MSFDKDYNSVVKVKILNEEYTLSGDRPVEEIKEIAKYVNNKMEEIYKNLPAASYKKIAVLSALNIAEELFDIKVKDVITDDVLNKTQRLIQILDSIEE